MKMVSVSSSSIAEIGYDEHSNTLAVLFNNGRLYNYYGVDALEFARLKNAESCGKYLNRNIKEKYRYKQII